ncbi:hypothetical protein OHB36_34095 [Streptomyces sp. NBC_00320]|uniref:hypothetical protein n=1 Tax=Streptomyces sp. NBC_00320 TaxID=2975711 RepID=UPI00224CEB99|nr:hypothetical protein [Streptomyces sp. NBC_00320]MCX5151726.1 hypothetical protein [Streptomyces sp. NBC_00320]
MRKAKWAAAAAGVVLLVAGCGSEDGADKSKGGEAPASGSSAPAVGAGAGSGGSGTLDAAAVKKEIESAATAAGFAEKPGDDVPANLKSCMVSWTADSKKVSDSRKSYDATVATLAKDGWKETRTVDQPAAVIKALDKSGWSVKASHQGKAGALLVVSFIATDNGPTCAKAFQEDLANNKH